MRSADGVSIGRKPKSSKLRRMISISRLNCSCSWGRYSWSKPRSKAGRTFCTSKRLDGDSLLAVFLSDVAFDDRLELLRNTLAFESNRLLAVDIDRRHRHFAGAGQADADIGMLGFARTVDYAAHHRNAHVLDAGICALPQGHLGAQIRLNAIGQFLEDRTGRAPAAGAGAD